MSHPSLSLRIEFNVAKQWYRILDGNDRLCGTGYRTKDQARAAMIAQMQERQRQHSNLRVSH